MIADEIKEREIVVRRRFNAPPSLVYEAWTNPKHVVHWWGPEGFTNTIHEMDVRPGGVWRFTMHGPGGRDFPNKITFHEVVKHQRLVYSHGSGEDDGENDFEVTVTFEGLGDQTELTMRSIFKTKEARDFVVKNFGAIEGANQTLSKLADYLPRIN